MLKLWSSGSWTKTEAWLESIQPKKLFSELNSAGRKGVRALSKATPVDTGKTAAAWDYTVQRTASGASITWTNSNDVAGEPLVLMLQFGHGTGTGGYVSGRDFINPAIQPVMDEIADDIWKKVSSG